MSRRIAFCADGTWDGTGNNTNVFRISNAIASIPGEQYRFYDSGVGADGTPIEKLAGVRLEQAYFRRSKKGMAASPASLKKEMRSLSSASAEGLTRHAA